MLHARPLSLDFRDGPLAASIKTPGRGLHKHRRENAVGQLSMTVGGAHRKKAGLRTPLKAPQTASKSQHLFTLKESGDTSKVAPRTVASKPLGDKTPFPNRAAPLAFQDGGPKALGKLPAPALAATASQTPAPAPLPSSTRKSTRPRRSGSLGLGGLALQFQTPRVNGCPWDVSDLDIQVPAPVEEEQAEAADQEDFDEIEYMPPKLAEQPYVPDFPMPDYKEVGKMLRTLAWSFKVDEAPQWSGDLDEDEERLLLQESGAIGPIETLSGPADDRPYFILDPLPAPAPKPTATAAAPAPSAKPSASHSRAPSNTTHRATSLTSMRTAPSTLRAASSSRAPAGKSAALPPATKAVPGAKPSGIPAASSSRSLVSSASGSRLAVTKRATPAPATTASKAASRPPPAAAHATVGMRGPSPRVESELGLNLELGLGAASAMDFEDFRFDV